MTCFFKIDAKQNLIKPILLLPLLVAAFLILLFPTNSFYWTVSQTSLISTVSESIHLSTTSSSKLVGYCIEQIGALETTSPNQYPSIFTKDQREVIPILSNQEITSYNRLFFAQNEEIIDPDGRLCKGAAKGYVQGGFAHYDNMTQVVAGAAGQIGSYLTPGVQEAAAVRDYTALAYHASNASVDIMSHGVNWQNGTELGTSVVGMYIGGSSTASIVVSGMDKVTIKAVQSLAAIKASSEVATVKGTQEFVTGYRAVSQAEFDDIAENGFRPEPTGRSMQDKWFSESREGAESFTKTFPEVQHIIKTDIPKSIYDNAYKNPNIDQTGPGFVVPVDQLSKLTPRLP